MAIRVDHTVAPQISRDSAQKQHIYFPDLNVEAVSTSAFTKALSGVLSVAVSSADILSFGDIDDVRGLYLEVDQACTIKLNGGVESIPIQPAPTGTKAKFFLEGTVTGIEVTNPSATTVLSGVWVVWGDPTS